MARQEIERFKPTTVFAGAGDQAEFSTRASDAAAESVDIRLLELLTARLCHELSGPVAAISNGVELLTEEETGFFGDAAALVGDSSRRAGSRLQFYRFAYGFSCGGSLAGPAPHELAVALFDTDRFSCDYTENVRTLPIDWQKLACNLLSLGADTLPHGGRLVLNNNPLSLDTIGKAAALPPEARAAMMLATPVARLTSRTVQAYFTGLLAKSLGCRLIGVAGPGRVRLSAVAAGG